MARPQRQVDPAVSRRRPERLEARVTAEQKALIERAAALQGRSVTDFVLATVQDAARRIVADHEILLLSIADSQRFVDALLDPQEPTEAMRDRIARYRTLMND